MQRLSRNFAWNLLGFGLPVAFAVVAIPALTAQAGLARFGFLSIAWAVIGYLGFLDLGLSRVFARRVAAARARNELTSEATILWRGCRYAFVATIVLALAAASVPVRWLMGDGGTLSPSELQVAWWVLLAALPALVATNLLRGAMEGLEAFRPVNLMRIGFGTWTFAGPLAVLAFTSSLPWLVFALTAARWVALIMHGAWCWKHLPRASHEHRASGAELWRAVREGLWVTVTNIVGPVMVVFDRFVLAAVIGLAAVSAYAIAQEIALRLLMIPAALAIAVFPRQSALSASSATDAEAGRLTDRSARVAVAMMVPVAVIGVAAADPVLSLWLGAEVARATAPVLSVALIGVVLNAAAQIAFGMLQAAGYARATALLHVAELPLYLLALWFASSWFGVTGAAAVWVLRILVDTMAMIWLARRVQPAAFGVRAVIGTFGGAALVLAAVTLSGPLVGLCAAVAMLAPVALIRRGEWPIRARARVGSSHE